MSNLNLIYLDFKLRFFNQYSNIIERYKLKEKISTKKLILISFFLKVFFAIPLYFLLANYINNINSINILYVVFGFMVISGLYQGVSSIKYTALVKSRMYLYAPISLSSVYNLHLMSSLTWSIFNKSGTTALFILLACTSLHILNAFLVIFNTMLLYLILFIASNKFFSLYHISKVRKPIGLIRFIFYLFILVISLVAGYLLVAVMKEPFKIIREDIVGIRILNDEKFAETVSLQLFHSIAKPFQIIFNHIFFTIDYVLENVLNSAVTLGVSIFLLFLLSLLKISPLVNRYDSINTNTKDIMYYLLKGFSILNKKTFKSSLLENELTLLSRERFLVSPKFFSMVFITYESTFFFGMLTGLLLSTENNMLQYLVYLSFILLIMFNHSFELRTEFPHIFLLGAFKNKLDLFRYSGRGIKPLFQSKVNLMSILMTIPTLLLMLITLILSFRDFKYLVAIIVIILTYKLVPLVQMWAATYLIKTEYVDDLEVGKTEEEGIIDKIQALPRKVLVLPVLFFLYSLLFIAWNKIVITYFLYIYFIYYLIGGSIFIIFAQKYADNNLKKYDSNWLRM